jgi:hypothetical protein
MRLRDRVPGFLKTIGWGPVGYAQEPIHVFNDEYTSRQLSQPFDRAWQGVQKHQQEADMVTEWDTIGSRNSYQTELMVTGRYQQYGAYDQIRGAWGPVPATAMMTSQNVVPQSQGLLADLVRAVKKTWTGSNA